MTASQSPVATTPRAVVGLLLGVCIGAGCRLSGIPLPAPEALVGALLVLALTLGHMAADRMLTPSRRPETVDGASPPEETGA